MRDGFFHADMHQGNLFVDDNGAIVAVDFGIMGRLGLAERRFLAEILHGLITRDYHRTAVIHFEAGYVPPHHKVEEFAQAMRAIGEPIHGRTAEEISMADLLGQLFAYTEVFDMQTRPELILLQKSMVIVEGVARDLDPGINVWMAAEPVAQASGWNSNLSLLGRLQETGRGAAAIGELLMRTPGLLQKAEQAILVSPKRRAQASGLTIETQEKIRARSRRSRAPMSRYGSPHWASSRSRLNSTARCRTGFICGAQLSALPCYAPDEMRAVCDCCCCPHRRREKDDFGDFGFGHAGILSVRAMHFEAVRTLRRKRHSERDKFFIASRNSAGRHRRAIEILERGHCRRREAAQLRQVRELSDIVHGGNSLDRWQTADCDFDLKRRGVRATGQVPATWNAR